MHTQRLRVGVLVGILFTGVIGTPTYAANLPAYDLTPHRTRVVTAATLGMTSQLYSDTPVYLQLPKGTVSFSTPNVIGATAYQYVFDQGGMGYLNAITLPDLTARQVAAQAGQQGYVIQNATLTAPSIAFHAGIWGNINRAQSQSSLSTGPIVHGQPDGAQYQAIGVGKYLYHWPADAYPASGSPTGTPVYIYGNPGNIDYQVDDSPLLTPPVTVSGTNLSTGVSATWQSPMAVVGSWDGGLVATPTYVPSGDGPNTQNYFTAQTQSGGIGTSRYLHTTADITSDPIWVGAVPGVGSDCVAFGIAGGAHPRVIVFDVVTGVYKTIGVGTIAAGVADTTVYDAATQTLFVQDLYGAIYAFGLNGTLEQLYAPPTWTNPTPILGQDMALNPQSAGPILYAVGGGGADLGALNPSDLTQSPFVTPDFSPGVASPSILDGARGHAAVVLSNAQGKLWINGNTELFVQNHAIDAQPIATPVGSAYIGYLPDAGPYHDLLGWTNQDPAGNPALVIYVPTAYTLTAAANGSAHATVASGQSVTLTANPTPTGITNGSADTPYGLGGVHSAPVDYLVNAGWQPMRLQRLGHWTAVWSPPANLGTQPVTYIVTVGGWPMMDATSTPMATTTVAVTVEPAPPPLQQTSTHRGTLSLACGFGAGGLPITVAHTCTLNGVGIPAGESAAWFVANPQYGAKFGDTIAVRLTVPSPPLPALPGLQVIGEQLHAQLPYTEGVPNAPGSVGDNPQGQSLYNPNRGVKYWMVPNTITLTPTGANSLTAKGYLIESWDGYPPHLQNANRGNTYTLHANWSLLTTYRYWVSYANGNGYWRTAHTTTSGTASAPVTVNGTDYYEVATPMGVGGY